MYRDTIQQIISETKPTLNISLEEVAAKVAERLGDNPPSRSTVKRILNELGYFNEKGKRRGWVYRHNKGNGE